MFFTWGNSSSLSVIYKLFASCKHSSHKKNCGVWFLAKLSTAYRIAWHSCSLYGLFLLFFGPRTNQKHLNALFDSFLFVSGSTRAFVCFASGFMALLNPGCSESLITKFQVFGDQSVHWTKIAKPGKIIGLYKHFWTLTPSGLEDQATCSALGIWTNLTQKYPFLFNLGQIDFGRKFVGLLAMNARLLVHLQLVTKHFSRTDEVGLLAVQRILVTQALSEWSAFHTTHNPVKSSTISSNARVPEALKRQFMILLNLLPTFQWTHKFMLGSSIHFWCPCAQWRSKWQHTIQHSFHIRLCLWNQNAVWFFLLESWWLYTACTERASRQQRSGAAIHCDSAQECH